MISTSIIIISLDISPSADELQNRNNLLRNVQFSLFANYVTLPRFSKKILFHRKLHPRFRLIVSSCLGLAHRFVLRMWFEAIRYEGWGSRALKLEKLHVSAGVKVVNFGVGP